MAEKSQEQIMQEVVRDIVDQYRQSQGKEQAALREIASKVYAEALRNTEEISDITLNARFGELQKIAAAADFSTNTAAAGRAIIEPVTNTASAAAEVMKARAEAWQENPLLEYTKMTAGPILNQIVNPSANIESAKRLVSTMVNAEADLLDKPYQAASRAINFPTDKERERLAAIYDLPYEKRIQALHGVTLEDTATIVSAGSMPGLFPKALTTAKESVHVAKEAVKKQIDNLPMPVGDRVPALAGAGPRGEMSVLSHIVMASQAGDVTPTSNSEGQNHTGAGDSAKGTSAVASKELAFSKIQLQEVNLKPMSVQLSDGRMQDVPIKLHIRPEDMVDATGKQRDFSKVGELLSQKLSERQYSSNRFEALDNIDMYYRGDAKVSDNYRKHSNVPTSVDDRVVFVLHTHDIEYRFNKPIANIKDAPPTAYVLGGSLREIDGQLALSSKKIASLATAQGAMENELNRLSYLHQGLSRTATLPEDQTRAAYYKAQGDLHQTILDDIKLKTQEYPDRTSASRRNKEVANTQETAPESNVSVLKHRDNDPRNLPNVLKPGQPEMVLMENGVVRPNRASLPVVHSVAMKEIALPSIKVGVREIPVNLTLPTEMDESHYSKVIVPNSGGLQTRELQKFTGTVDTKALSAAIYEFVRITGGANGGELSGQMEKSISDISVVYLGARKARESDVGIFRGVDRLSDDRVLVVAHVSDFAGKEMKPITLSGGIQTPDSPWYQLKASRGELNPNDTPIFVAGGKRSVNAIHQYVEAELDILADNAKFYSAGDILASRRELGLNPTQPNVEQQLLNTRRYVELDAALNAFDQSVNRHLNSSQNLKDIHSSAEPPPKSNTDEPLALLNKSSSDHAVNYLQHEEAREIVMAQLIENKAKQTNTTRPPGDELDIG